MDISGSFVSSEEYERRIGICNSCEHLRVVLGVNQCSLCGCLLMAKARLKAGTCPIKKWEV